MCQTSKQGPEFGNYRQDLLTFLLENTKNFRPKEILFSRTFKTQLIVSRCFRLRLVKAVLKNQAIQCFSLFGTNAIAVFFRLNIKSGL